MHSHYLIYTFYPSCPHSPPTSSSLAINLDIFDQPLVSRFGMWWRLGNVQHFRCLYWAVSCTWVAKDKSVVSVEPIASFFNQSPLSQQPVQLEGPLSHSVGAAWTGLGRVYCAQGLRQRRYLTHSSRAPNLLDCRSSSLSRDKRGVSCFGLFLPRQASIKFQDTRMTCDFATLVITKGSAA